MPVISPPGISRSSLSSSTVEATGGSAARALSDWLGDTVNIRSEGGVSDGKKVTGTSVTVTNGTGNATVTLNDAVSAVFAASDVGKIIGLMSTDGSRTYPWSNYVTISAVSGDGKSVTVNASASTQMSELPAVIVWGTDNSPAFGRAAGRITEMGGGQIYVPSGNYVVGKTTKLPSNTLVCGDGPSSVILSAGIQGVQGSSGDGCAFTNISTGTQGGLTSTGSFVQTSGNQNDSNYRIKDIVLDWSVNPAGSGNKALFFTLATHIIVKGCQVISDASRVDGIAFIGCDDVLESGNTSRGVGIAHDHWGGCTRIRVVDNVIDCYGPQGINMNGVGTNPANVEATSDFVIRSNTLRLYGNTVGINLDALGPGSSTTDGRVTNNSIKSQSGSGNLGIVQRGAGGQVAIEGNTFTGLGDGQIIECAAKYTGPVTLTDPFTTQAGSSIVTVKHANHGQQNGVYVDIGSASVVGGITLSGYYAITYVGPNSYTITAGSAASSGATGGGSPSVFYYQGQPSGNRIVNNVFYNCTRSDDALIKMNGRNHLLSGNVAIGGTYKWLTYHDGADAGVAGNPGVVAHNFGPSGTTARHGYNPFTVPLIIDPDGGNSRWEITGPIDAFDIATGGSAYRKFSDRWAERVNVRDQGAVGDGVTDDSGAFIRAINRCNTINATGVRVVLYVPGGVYLIKGTNGNFPTFTRNGGIVGDGPQLSWIQLDSSYSGDLFSWSEAWAQSNYPNTGAVNVSAQAAGPMVRSITISGDRTAAQNALVFYDRNDFVLARDINIFNIRGRGVSFGQMKNMTQAYLRESQFHNIRLSACGDTGIPVWEFNASGNSTGGSEIDASSIEIYGPYGPGMVIRNAATGGNLRDYRFNRLRIEGLETGGVSADLLTIGDSSLTGQVNTIMFNQLQLISPYTGYAAMRVTHSSSSYSTRPSAISVAQGYIGQGGGSGKGLVLDAVRDSQFYFIDIGTVDTQVNVGPSSMAGPNIFIFGGGREAIWTYSIDPSSYGQVLFPAKATGLPTGGAHVSRMVLKGTTSDSSAIRLTADEAAAGASNTVNMTTGTARHITIKLIAVDTTNKAKSYSYYNEGLLTMGFAAPSTALALGTAVEHSSGAPGTISTSPTADTILGALDLSWAPPAANTDTWDVIALIEWVTAS